MTPRTAIRRLHRSFYTIVWSAGDPLDDPDGFLAAMDRYAAMGVQQLWLSARTDDPAAWVSKVTERFMPALREM